MSEYTDYYAVRSSNKFDVQKKLNEAKIYSIVDADEDQYWFMDEFKTNKPYEWVIIHCINNISIPGNFMDIDHKKLSRTFESYLHFFEDEDRKRWELTIYFNESYTELSFNDDKEYSFSDEEKKTLSNFFGKEFDQLKPYLKYGKGGEFLNASGVPNFEMYDQNLLYKDSFEFGDGYCLLADDLED